MRRGWQGAVAVAASAPRSTPARGHALDSFSSAGARRKLTRIVARIGTLVRCRFSEFAIRSSETSASAPLGPSRLKDEETAARAAGRTEARTDHSPASLQAALAFSCQIALVTAMALLALPLLGRQFSWALFQSTLSRTPLWVLPGVIRSAAVAGLKPCASSSGDSCWGRCRSSGCAVTRSRAEQYLLGMFFSQLPAHRMIGGDATARHTAWSRRERVCDRRDLHSLRGSQSRLSFDGLGRKRARLAAAEHLYPNARIHSSPPGAGHSLRLILLASACAAAAGLQSSRRWWFFSAH